VSGEMNLTVFEQGVPKIKWGEGRPRLQSSRGGVSNVSYRKGRVRGGFTC
jgi:hypothetical protein